MDYSHHKSPNQVSGIQRISETRDEKSISHGKPYEMHFSHILHIVFSMINMRRKPCDMDLSHNCSQHGESRGNHWLDSNLS